jgi:hypothetical protein
MPVGATVPVSLVLAPARSTFWYMRSWNSARWRLNPTVFMLAMLLEMTSTFICWALMPVAAVLSARMVSAPYWPRPSRSTARRDRSWLLSTMRVMRS